MFPDDRVNHWSVDEAVDGSVGIYIDPSPPLSPEEVVEQFKQSVSIRIHQQINIVPADRSFEHQK